ncbi:glycerol-3-phosphate 1-O-acyltransferase PlsY [Verrucomicrobiaceae bacterium 227]
MLWLIPLLGFSLGSIPFGLILGKLKGVDIREHGSGNIGATNVFRTLGKKIGITCLLLDFLKGFLPVFIAIQLTPHTTTGQSIEVITALAAILGHNYSPWIGFKGGKGIATSGGALIALMPVGVLLLIIIFIIVTKLTKYVSVGSIATAISLPLVFLLDSSLRGEFPHGDWNKPLFIFSLVAGALAVWKHRANITRLRAGTENRIGQKKKETTS